MSDIDELKAQLQVAIAALRSLAPERVGPKRAEQTVDELGRWYYRRATKQAKYTLGPFLRDFGAMRASELTRAAYIEWRDERAEEPTIRGGKRAVGTLNLELATAQAFFRACVAADLIDANPLEGISELKGQRPRETEIAPDEHAAAFEDAPLLVRVFQTLTYEAGLRFNEARLMEWSHVDWQRHRIHIPREHVKGKLAARDVPMTDHLADALKAYPRTVGKPWVFTSPQTGQPYSKTHLTRLCRPYLDRLTPAPGDGRVVTHDGRHSAVSRMARGGMNALAAMKIAGHRTASMHWRYVHVTDGDLDQARRVLDGQRRR